MFVFTDPVVSIVVMKEDEMNKRSRRFLTALLCTAIFSNSACSTTTQRLGPTQAAMNNYGIGKGDTVLIRYSNGSEKIRIIGINESGISGIGKNGEAVNVGYHKIFQIEYEKVGLIKSDSPALMRTGKVLEVVATVLGGG